MVIILILNANINCEKHMTLLVQYSVSSSVLIVNSHMCEMFVGLHYNR